MASAPAPCTPNAWFDAVPRHDPSAIGTKVPAPAPAQKAPAPADAKDAQRQAGGQPALLSPESASKTCRWFAVHVAGPKAKL